MWCSNAVCHLLNKRFESFMQSNPYCVKILWNLTANISYWFNQRWPQRNWTSTLNCKVVLRIDYNELWRKFLLVIAGWKLLLLKHWKLGRQKGERPGLSNDQYLIILMNMMTSSYPVCWETHDWWYVQVWIWIDLEVLLSLS